MWPSQVFYFTYYIFFFSLLNREDIAAVRQCEKRGKIKCKINEFGSRWRSSCESCVSLFLTRKKNRGVCPLLKSLFELWFWPIQVCLFEWGQQRPTHLNGTRPLFALSFTCLSKHLPRLRVYIIAFCFVFFQNVERPQFNVTRSRLDSKHLSLNFCGSLAKSIRRTSKCRCNVLMSPQFSLVSDRLARAACAPPFQLHG